MAPGQPAARRNPAQLIFEPGFHGLEERPCLRLPGPWPCVGRLATEAFFNGIEIGDPAQGLGGDRRAAA